MTYKVDLDIYNGPMDLLLYLIRREEVDIRDIPIARIADQYVAYLDALVGLDIELAGDFVVMAATLLELKSRALLPRPPETQEGEEEADLEDPRETLIRQLIEYRRFKEAAAMLGDRGRDMARRFPRQVDERLLEDADESAEDGPPPDFLKGVEVWDLISAFSQVIRTLGYSQPREVIYDDTPVEEAATRLLERIEKEKSVLFTQLFASGRSVTYLITMFLAVLELVRQRKIGAEQEADFKDVRLFLRDPATETVVAKTPKGARQSRDALVRKGPRRPSAHQVENLREMLEDPQIEKTEFDEILDSIRVPDVESFKPLYSEDELLGKKDARADQGAAPAETSEKPPEAQGAAPGPRTSVGNESPATDTTNRASGDERPPSAEPEQ